MPPSMDDGLLEVVTVQGVLQLLNSDASSGKAAIPLRLGANAGVQVTVTDSVTDTVTDRY